MRSWWKSLGIMGVVAGLALGQTAARAQFPPGPGAMGMPPGPMMPTSMPPPGAFNGNPAMMGNPADFPNAAVPSGEPVSPFSIKDEGLPNAFSELIDPRLCRPACFQINMGYSFLWFRAQPFPPLVTTGDINDPFPGAIHQPGTQILSTTFLPGPSAAFRVSAIYWLRDPELCGLEGTFFVMEQRSIYRPFSSDATGNPVLARPYLNPVVRVEDADPRALPGIFKGTTSDEARTRLMGAEVNLRFQDNPQMSGSRFNYLLGARWLRLDERYYSFDTIESLAGQGSLTTISDTFTTYNQFFGGQLGLEWHYRLDRFTFSLLGKIAAGPNYQTIKIKGETTFFDNATAVATVDPQGLYAQPTNSGVYRQIKFAVLGEVTANLGFDLTDRCRFNVGYTFMQINNTVRPGMQIDRNVNIQPLQNQGNLFTPLVPEAPTFRQTFFYAHMLNLGLEFTF